MSNGLPSFDPLGDLGRQVNATRLNAIVGGLRSGRLQPSSGMRTTETAGGTTSVPIVRRYPPRVLPPFWPLFEPAEADDESDWTVTITKGVVAEIRAVGSPAIILHELLDLIDENGAPTKFPIIAGQAVYVKYQTDEGGNIITTGEGKPQISIDVAGIESTNPVPADGETPGEPGRFARLLAVFEVDADGNPIPENFEAGGHIAHHKTRGANVNMEIYQTTFSNDEEGHLVATRANLPEYTLYFRNGLAIGVTEMNDSPGNLLILKVDRNSVPS